MATMSAARLVLVLVESFLLAISVRADDQPLELKWVQLMPPGKLPDNFAH